MMAEPRVRIVFCEGIRLSMILQRLGFPVAAGLLVCVAAGTPARADFRLCNNATTRASVAIAYTDGQTWVTEGWWNMKSGSCEILLRGPLAAEYYYVYAMDERGGEWKGKAFMCTSDREFKIEGRQDCFVRGYERTGFFEVDTGKDAKNWTVQLTDPVNP
jgi:uncharacterized membrane protein